MQNKDMFSSYHPSVNFLYFGLVLVITMFFMHPVCLFISFLGALIYYIKLKGSGSFLKILKFILPMGIFAILINSLFNHGGVTVLGYLPGGNAFTLESVLYGLGSSLLLANVLLWFGCYNEIMTSDKFIYLFGKLIPSLSLVLSMVLRFVPRFKKQFKEVKNAQKALIGNNRELGFCGKIKNTFMCFSAMVTWSLENSIETSDSMKARGYGLKGRTAFSIYSVNKRDVICIIWFFLLGTVFFICAFKGGLKWQYFPLFDGEIFNAKTIVGQICFALLSLTPIFIDLREERKWQLLK